ncbi:MAG: TRAP transporter large permease [Pseudomonadota bacterium]|uniref:TRAP transporter large permease n=1 Tax=Candidatus Desulfatibia profunda TaxID=2841695 RepID=A0A8J6NQG3_9BACT|nr:TRAP transporter large permease [Candidatus Desulfatibia profunda]MBL7179637.1 TRAP transporter large permease [Desulfobacterales bacterium]
MFGIPQNVAIWIITIITGLFFIVGVPIFLCVAFWATMGSIAIDFTIQNIGITSYQGISSYALLAMPLFILTGDLIGAGGIAKKLSIMARRVLAPLRGGLAMASIATCSLFSAISGSNSATVATIGRIMIPELTDQGYRDEFAAATVAAGGIVGILIPPSILMIVYAFTVNLSVLDLFKAGILPGILVSIALMAAARYWCHKYDWGRPEPFIFKEVLRATWGAKLGIAAVVLILVIIYGGISSPTEASGIAAAYCLLAGVLLTREIKLKDIPAIFLSSGRVNGLLAPVVSVSIVLQQVFSILGVQDAVSQYIHTFESKYVIMGLMMFSIILAGAIMESISVTIILAPILAPIAVSVGMNPIHWGAAFIVGLSIGFITPPFGLDLFVASGITGIPYDKLIKWVPPYILFVLIAWIIIMMVPWFSLVFV